MAKGGDENARIRSLIDMDKADLPSDGGERFNRLIFATSPYLLQHAENPVDWYPWGAEAFEAARRENKPVFLSIGYATCHWCHVMAHESFEDVEVAEAINRQFVPVKVDREERPDIDAQYMVVAQMMTGSGGWPLTIVMTPEGEPFFAATYLPRTARMGMPGIITILDRLSQFWRVEPEKVAENCQAIIQTLKRYHGEPHRPAEGNDSEPEAFRQLKSTYDQRWGGFGEAPKFPLPLNISFLLRYGSRRGDPKALEMASHTLRHMRQGGIFDQVGFGFHRYSVDEEWLVPHFEKMLYDQALLAVAYLEAYQATGDPFHRQVAEEIFQFVLRELTSDEGSFYAALDADSEGEEGKFYLWGPQEVEAVLGKEAGRFCDIFDITAGGNFEGRNIPRLKVPLVKLAEQEGRPVERFYAELEPLRLAMLAAREGRPRPLRDTKAIAAWNGMMVAALAKGYAVTGDAKYLDAADRGASFILKRLIGEDGRLMRSYHLGRATVPGFLEDYAAVAWAFLSLFDATLDARYRDEAALLGKEMIRLYGSESGFLYDTGSDVDPVLLRMSNFHDGAVPSGNSLAALVLLKLGRTMKDDTLFGAGRDIVAVLGEKVSQQPAAHLGLVMAQAAADPPTVEITCSLPPGMDSARGEMVSAINRRFFPEVIVRLAGDDEPEYASVGGAPTVYVCAGGACHPAVTNVSDLETLLDSLFPH